MNPTTPREMGDCLIAEFPLEIRHMIARYRPEIIHAFEYAVERERDACFKIADEAGAWCRSFTSEETAERIAAAIRARGDTTE